MNDCIFFWSPSVLYSFNIILFLPLTEINVYLCFIWRKSWYLGRIDYILIALPKINFRYIWLIGLPDCFTRLIYIHIFNPYFIFLVRFEYCFVCNILFDFPFTNFSTCVNFLI